MIEILAQLDIVTEALQQTSHRTDGTFLAVVVIIVCAFFGWCLSKAVNRTLDWVGTKIVEPAMKAGVAHLDRVQTHLDEVTALVRSNATTLDRNTDALDSLNSTLANLPCQLAQKQDSKL